MIDLWIKALHVVAVISWMAGLLYLPRLFVYHADAPTGSERSETFKVMERRLLHVIMRPAMAVVWISGLWLAWRYSHHTQRWFQAKLALVVVLSAYHGALAAWLKGLAADQRDKTARFFRIVNEVPTALMIAIVILVIVRPF